MAAELAEAAAVRGGPVFSWMTEFTAPIGSAGTAEGTPTAAIPKVIRARTIDRSDRSLGGTGAQMTLAVVRESRSRTARRTLRHGVPGHGHQWVVTTPGAEPDLWREYLDGAARSYGAHGVEDVAAVDQIADGATTALLFAAVADEGRVVGGIRTAGVLAHSEDAVALRAWDGHPERARARALFEERVPFGVVELKTGWVARDAPERRRLTASLARTPLHAALILGARYGMGAGGGHSLRMWTASGGVVARELAPLPFPDERYETHLVWWDRWMPATTVTEDERRALDAETAQLVGVVSPAAAS